jgi:hypothetical protein
METNILAVFVWTLEQVANGTEPTSQLVKKIFGKGFAVHTRVVTVDDINALTPHDREAILTTLSEEQYLDESPEHTMLFGATTDPELLNMIFGEITAFSISMITETADKVDDCIRRHVSAYHEGCFDYGEVYIVNNCTLWKYSSPTEPIRDEEEEQC